MIPEKVAHDQGGTMIVGIRIFSVFFLLLTFLFLSSPGRSAGTLPVEAFGRMPAFSDVTLSKYGTYLARQEEFQGKYYLAIFRVDGTKLTRMHTMSLGELHVRWIAWLTDRRLLVSIAFADFRYAVPTMETRLIAMDYDGSHIVSMYRNKRGRWIPQIQDNVVDLLPDDPDHILMKYNPDDPSRPRVYRVNVHTGRASLVQAGKKGVTNWLTDQAGRVRIGTGLKDGVYQIIVRPPDSKAWRVLRARESLSTEEFVIYGFAQDPNVIYVGSNHEGGTRGVYEYDLRTDQFVRKIFRHPEVDVLGLAWNQERTRISRIFFALEGMHSFWIEPGFKMLFDRVASAFPNKKVSIVSRTLGDSRTIIHVGSVTDGGRYYVFDSRANLAITLGPNYPELEGVPLGEMFPFDYHARDGLRIPAYLSLPAGYDKPSDAKNLPLVVMPHGGPTARDVLIFDPFVHVLTNRGYAVLQMNFRGSAGYGAEFEAAGYRQWGRKMQDDITDGVMHLVSEGIADRDRVCIYGASYGGYAALMGAVKTPDLYKCAISLNGVFDLRKFIRGLWKYVGGRSGYRTAHIGNYSERDFLEEVSPSKRAAEIKIPVLVVHAKDDRVVPFDQSKTMVGALKRAGVDYEFLELRDGGHGLNTTASRLAFMQALDRFLARHLK